MLGGKQGQLVMASAGLEAFVDESIRLAQLAGVTWTFPLARAREKTIPAIKRLVTSSKIQSGFRKMVRAGYRDQTLEAGVIKFHDEFDQLTITWAKARLELADKEIENAPRS
jgi:hypothetical protein